MFDGGGTLGVRRKARPPHRVMRPRRRSPYWHNPERLQGLAGIAGGQGWTPLGVAGTHGVGALVALLPATGTTPQEDHRLGPAGGHAAA